VWIYNVKTSLSSTDLLLLLLLLLMTTDVAGPDE
jgi:hypothetical protein